MDLRRAAIPILLVGPLVFAGCGSSSPAAPHAQVNAAVPARLAPADLGSEAGVASRMMPAVVPGPTGARVERAFNRPTGTESNETGARPVHPCLILRAADVTRVTHVRVLGTTEAPIGPTCIYRLAQDHMMFTFAVENLTLGTTAGPASPHRLTAVGRHRAYCRTTGRPTLLVALPGARVLSVQAPCAKAAGLAAAALRRLAG